MEFLYNKSPQVDFDNIHEFSIAVMSTNKAEFLKWMGVVLYLPIMKLQIFFYIVCFKSFPYKPQEYVVSGGNEFISSNPIWGSIYTSPGRKKWRFMLSHVKYNNCDCANDHICYYNYWC